MHTLSFSRKEVVDIEKILKQKSSRRGRCVFWTGAVGRHYGIIKRQKHGKIRNYQVHRLAYYIYNGDPGNLHVLHSCDNPLCINPAHLWLGTHQQNMHDCTVKGRRPSKVGASDIEALCRLRLTGVSLKEIAARFKICESRVSVLYKKYGPQPFKDQRRKNAD